MKLVISRNKLILTIAVLFAVYITNAQQAITLDQCFESARINHPLLPKLELIDQIGNYQVQNVKKQNLPRIDLKAQTTYQSDVSAVPIEVPGFEIESLSKDQYKITSDIYQSILDGGRVKSAATLQEANIHVNQSLIETELYKLKTSILNIYFGILKNDIQHAQTEKTHATVEAQLKKTEAAVENGISLPSNRDALRAELLQIEQKQSSITFQRQALIKQLITLTGRDIDMSNNFDVPEKENITSAISGINRPELDLFQSMRNALDAKQSLIDASVKPTIGAFIQLGYGKPGLNFLENNFSPYYIAGLRMNWNLAHFYTKKNESDINLIEASKIQADENHFLRNLKMVEDQYRYEIEEIQTTVRHDEEILKLREQITRRAEAQLENGVITSTEYILELNAEEIARINSAFHQLEINQLNHQIKILYGLN